MCQVGDVHRRRRVGEWRGCVFYSSLARSNERCILEGGEFEWLDPGEAIHTSLLWLIKSEGASERMKVGTLLGRGEDVSG